MFASRNCGGEYLIADMRERIAKASVMVQTYHGQAREGGKERRDPETEQPGANQKMAGQKWLSNIGKNSRSWNRNPFQVLMWNWGTGYASQVVSITVTDNAQRL